MTFSLAEVFLHVLAGVDELCVRISHVYCPIFVKSDVKYMHTASFVKIGIGRAFLILWTLCGVITSDRVRVKNALFKSVLCHRGHSWRSCLMLNFVCKATKLISWHCGLCGTFVFDSRSLPLPNRNLYQPSPTSIPYSTKAVNHT